MTRQILKAVVLAAVLAAMVAALAACGGKQSRRISPTRTSRDFAVVKVRPGDTLNTLANRYLHDPDKGWIIASYNEVETIAEGDVLTIPLSPVNLGGIGQGVVQTVPVLAYSGFSEDTSDALTVSRADFEAHMQFIKDQGYTPISLDTFYDFLDFQEQAPAKSVVITIDDVGQNTYSVAYPVLKKFGFPAAVFVATDMVTGQGSALSWDQIRTMAGNGVTIGHRTKTLRNLTRRQADETFEDFVIAIDREMTVPTLTFRQEIGDDPKYFAYPFGSANELVISLLMKNKFRGAMTLAKGSNPFYVNDYLVRRNAVPGTMAMAEFQKLFEFTRQGGAQ
ncbi:polysaccharide deacetylase family protein [Desulfocurvus sp. DL9XJH121]